ncbi:MAG: nucleotidyltransferase domain-containing protein [Oceanicaulis sp.]|uniref:nucleotidyltransferase family protein n=1 Tax=Glycocaulis sp. TaxID=1969725 RepID=UPI0025C0F947|nr:nucleotidyltransferase domain-containing protein [Glycocaulis sp.]MCC5982229.1 nucleotidyltransferase domain-containing protein [Oceanicaulis sp.]MCH8520966.1 nucleotidyltransferase domain-containing protein [Glycocaulis sp.]
MDTALAIPTLDDARARLIAERDGFRALGVTAITLFGSIASGKAHQASDVDVVIETAGDSFGYDALIAVAERLEDIFLRDVDVIHARSLSPELASEVRATGVRIVL